MIAAARRPRFRSGPRRRRAIRQDVYMDEIVKGQPEKELKLEIEVLEERIAPSAHGSLGYEGQPGNQGNGLHGYEGQPGNQGGGNHNP